MKTLLLLPLLLSSIVAVTSAVEDKPEMLAAKEMASTGRFLRCPSGWDRYRHGCYQYVSSGRSWTSAVAYCSNLGATLASVQDGFDYSFLQDLTARSGGSVAWMGGFYFQGWRWLDQRSFTYTYWSSQNSATSYPCIHLNARGGWSNNNCNNGWPFICMKRTDTC